jgi:hypothetical protein
MEITIAPSLAQVLDKRQVFRINCAAGAAHLEQEFSRDFGLTETIYPQFLDIDIMIHTLSPP